MSRSGASAYYGGVNPDLLFRIPVTARHVLEVGCGSGALAKSFRSRSPDVIWSGIEVMGEAAELARGSLDAVLCADVEDLPDIRLDSFLAGRPAPDVLVLGDVLEHLREPARALDRLVSRLAPGSAVVACIPNIGHWTIVENLLRGHWTYTDMGLLDRTHLRFFTRASASDLLHAAGLRQIQVAPRDIPVDPLRQEGVFKVLLPAAASLGLDPADVRARMSAYQYVFRGVKAPAEQPMHVHHLIMVPQLHDARILAPMTSLATIPGVRTTQAVRSNGLPEPAPSEPRILVVQRQLVRDRAAWLSDLARVVSKGWLVVGEWDDHPSLLLSPSRETWQLNPWLPFSGMHALQVSTPLLAVALRDHNPEVAVLPNALLDLPPLADRDGSRIQIVCATVARPGLADIVAPALDAAAEADPRVAIDIVASPELFGALRTSRKTHHPLLAYGDYLDLLARSDISVMPIQGLPPERYKSPLKFLEGASRGAACIGSPVLYEGVIEHGINGMLADTPDQWIEAVVGLVRDEELRRRLAAEGWRTVRDRHLQCHHVGRRVAWYRDLWARRRELRAALAARHPEIGATVVEA